MRILQLAKYVPIPSDSGGKVRVRGLAEALSRFADVELLAYDDGDRCGDIDIHPYCTVQTVAHPSGLPGLLGQFLRVTHGAPLRSARYATGSIVRRLSALIESRRYDALQVEELGMMAPLVRNLRRSRIPIVYSAHNAESALSPQLLRASGFPLQLFAGVEAERTRVEERAAFAAARRAIVVSQADLRQLTSIGCDVARCVVVPNCCPSEVKMHPTVREGEVLFVGSMGWLPNLDGIRWLLDRVVGPLRQMIPDARVTVVGTGVPRQMAGRMAACGCDLYPDASDLNPFYARARVAIVPLRLGGGTRIKITEAWTAGVPVVSTSVGAAGLLDEDPRGVLVADAPGDFAAAITQVINDDNTYLALRAEGLRRAPNHSWGAWRATLDDLYKSILVTP